MHDITFKILMVGESNVGKSCLLLKYVNDMFSSTFITTIGIDFKCKYLEFDNKRIKLQIWDTAGQERFKSITTAYFRGAQGAVLVYDVTNRASFERIRNWLSELHKAGLKNKSIILVANKVDLDKRVVDMKEGYALAEKFDLKYFECSAKTGYNVDIAFETIAKNIYSILQPVFIEDINKNETISIHTSTPIKTKCC